MMISLSCGMFGERMRTLSSNRIGQDNKFFTNTLIRTPRGKPISRSYTIYPELEKILEKRRTESRELSMQNKRMFEKTFENSCINITNDKLLPQQRCNKPGYFSNVVYNVKSSKTAAPIRSQTTINYDRYLNSKFLMEKNSKNNPIVKYNHKYFDVCKLSKYKQNFYDVHSLKPQDLIGNSRTKCYMKDFLYKRSDSRNTPLIRINDKICVDKAFSRNVSNRSAIPVVCEPVKESTFKPNTSKTAKSIGSYLIPPCSSNLLKDELYLESIQTARKISFSEDVNTSKHTDTKIETTDKILNQSKSNVRKESIATNKTRNLTPYPGPVEDNKTILISPPQTPSATYRQCFSRRVSSTVLSNKSEVPKSVCWVDQITVSSDSLNFEDQKNTSNDQISNRCTNNVTSPIKTPTLSYNCENLTTNKRKSPDDVASRSPPGFFYPSSETKSKDIAVSMWISNSDFESDLLTQAI